MAHRLTLDKAGRIVLPKPLRQELRLEPGDTLEIESSGEELTLRPSRGNAQLQKKQGVWVYRADEPLAAAVVKETARQVRREREVKHLRKHS